MVWDLRLEGLGLRASGSRFFSIASMCRVLGLAVSGFRAYKLELRSKTTIIY